MIAIVDYGMGNLRSVEKALDKLGFVARVTSDAGEISSSGKLVVPGVGAFGDAMHGLGQRGLIEPIRQFAMSGKPVLGICLGMQIFFEESEEDPGIAGIGLLAGSVQRFRSTHLKIPHMGWNNLNLREDSRLFSGLENPFVYFVHSYYVVPADSSVAAASVEYGERFTAAVETGCVFGTQFHPEKSQAVGMAILRNFGNL